MATDHRKSVEQEKAPKSGIRTEHEHAQVSTYTIEELTKAHKVFHTSHEIVAVALKLAGIKRATVEEARTIIEEFKNKEVK